MRFVIILVVLLAVVVGIWACAMQPAGPEAEPETARAGARETGGPAAGTTGAPAPRAERPAQPPEPVKAPAPKPEDEPPAPEHVRKDGLELYSTYSSVGVRIEAGGRPSVAYRRSGAEKWLAGHEMSDIGKGRWASSLLLLDAGTNYEVKVTVPAAGGADEKALSSRARTWEDEPAAPAPDVKAIMAKPGSLQEAIDRAVAGAVVQLTEGDYYESVSLGASGGEDRPLWIKGTKGARILGCRRDMNEPDGADRWKPVDGAKGVFEAKLDHTTGFAAAKGKRLFHYQSLDEVKALTHSWKGKSYNVGGGWWQAGDRTLYVKLDPAADPDTMPMQVARRNLGIEINGKSNIVIDGVEMAYFGTGKYGRAIDIRDSEDVVVQNCRIHHCRTGVAARGQKTERITVQRCRLYDSSIPEWPWPCNKAHDTETSAISFNGGRGLVARRNDISDYFNGVIASMWGRLEEEGWNADIDCYENRFWDVTDDPMEPEGTCINNRYFLNTAARGCHQGISLCPITRGPVYVFHNLFYRFTGGAFKVSNDSKGPVYIYHNTGHTSDPKKNGMGSSGQWDNMHFRNNVLMSTRYTVETYRPKPKSTWDYNCHFTTAEGILLKWENNRFKTLEEFAAKGHEKHGVNADPRFRDAAGEDFRLAEGSPCIDKGTAIPGLYIPVNGVAPDMGCFEAGSDFGPPKLP